MSGSETAPLMIAPGVLGTMASALQARLQTVFPPAKRFGFQLMPAQMSPAEWETIASNAPFVGLGWQGFSDPREHDNTFRADAHWSVFLLTKNGTSVPARFLGDTLGVGLFRMVQSAIAILNGWTVPDVGPCYVRGGGNVTSDGWNSQGCAIAHVDVSINFGIDAADVLDFGAVPTLNEDVATYEAPDGTVLLTDDNQVQA